MQLAQPFFFEGNDRAVLLLHGYTGSTADVRRTGRAINAAGYTVYAINLTGHAENNIENILDAGPDIWYQDVKDAFTYLHDKGYEDVAVFGLSLGGAFALRAAIDGLSPIGAGLFCSAIIESIYESNIYDNFIKYAITEKRRKGTPLHQMDEEMEEIKQKMPKQFDENDQFFMNIQNDLNQLTVPFYIAEAGKDEMISPNSGENLKKEIKNAPVTFYSFPNSPHVITIGEDFVEFQNTVIDFLNNLDWKQ